MMLNILKSSMILVMCLVIAFLTACAKEPIGVWSGEYQYEAYLGKTASQTPVIMNYVLTLGMNNICRLNIQGYQVDNQIICGTIEEGHDDIHITFKSFADGSLKNPYGIAVYQPDEKLFSLNKKDGELETTWHAIKPDDNHATGIHFKKLK
jgi:hypothetical protein